MTSASKRSILSLLRLKNRIVLLEEEEDREDREEELFDD